MSTLIGSKLIRASMIRALETVVPPTILGAVLPYGRSPISVDTWNTLYTTGQYDFVTTAEHVSRYGSVAAYCCFFTAGGRVLDVGCGRGLLLKYLPPEAISSYVGIDVSEAAIQMARAQFPRAHFEVADATIYEPPHDFEVIVFNDSLYYFPFPEQQVERYAQALTSDGLIVASMWRHAHAIRAWNRLRAGFVTLDGVCIVRRYPNRRMWDIAALRPTVRIYRPKRLVEEATMLTTTRNPSEPVFPAS